MNITLCLLIILPFVACNALPANRNLDTLIEAETEKNVYGHYVSVWRKDADGLWKVIVDIGIAHAEPEAVSKEVASTKPLSAVLLPLLFFVQ